MHLYRILYYRQCLIFQRLHPQVIELGGLKRGIQQGRRIPCQQFLTPYIRIFYKPVRKSLPRLMTGLAAPCTVTRKGHIRKQYLPQRYLFR